MLFERPARSTDAGYGDFYGASWTDAVRQLNNGVDNFSEWLAAIKGREMPPVTTRHRKRRYNDIDGDIEFERRWDDRPFEQLYKEPVHSPLVRLFINAGFNAGVSSTQIMNYGIRIYELLNSIETSGRSVELNFYYYDEGVYTNIADKLLWTEVLIKRSTEFAEPQVIASCLTPFFLRRFMFREWAYFGGQMGWETSSGYGRAMAYKDKPLTIEGNCVYIDHSNPSRFNEEVFTATLDEILTTLK
jgi:hypothetical protein